MIGLRNVHSKKQRGINMDINVIGIDLAKRVFQVHGVDKSGAAVLRKKLSRAELVRFMVNLKPCVVAMEACGSSHFWGREFRKMGHQVRLIPAQYVKPFVKTNKSDANDAEAIVEAATRPNMRFVPIKELEHQDIQCLHRARERLVKQKVALVNQIRGFCQEYGVMTPESRHKMISQLGELIDSALDRLTPVMTELLREHQEELRELMERITKMDRKLQMIFKAQPICQLLESIPGVGVMTATAVWAAVVDPNQFKNGRAFSSWLGLVPQQHSTGGRNVLLGISKRGDRYLRKLIVHGARSRTGEPGLKTTWMQQVEQRRGRNKAVVAQANKNARMIWAVMARKEAYRSAA